MRKHLIALSTCLLTLASATTLLAGTIITRDADFDRWNYPFNSSPGLRNLASTFGAIGGGAFDDFDGQFLVGFELSTDLPALGPGESYLVHSVQVTATHSTGAFAYDPTFDNYATYLDASDPDFVADHDAGRPVELWGAGLRNGYSSFGFAGPLPPTAPPTFNSGSFFAFADPTLVDVRNAFAFDPLLGNVSNVITDRLLTAEAWATGTVAGLSPGAPVAEGVPGVSTGSTFTFDVDLSRPEILSYIETGLGNGQLFFTIASLHEAAQQAGGTNPNFYTGNNFDPFAVEPTLTIDVEVVPEPATGLLLVSGGVLCLGLLRRFRRSGAA